MSHDSGTQSEATRARVHDKTLLQHADDAELQHLRRRDVAKDWKTEIRVSAVHSLFDSSFENIKSLMPKFIIVSCSLNLSKK